MDDQLFTIMTLDNGPQLIGTDLKPSSLDFLRDDILAPKRET